MHYELIDSEIRTILIGSACDCTVKTHDQDWNLACITHLMLQHVTRSTSISHGCPIVKRANPSHRSSNWGNPSWVIFRHSTEFFRGYYSRTAEVTFSKPPEKKWRERDFICFGFVSYRRCLCSRAFGLFFCSFGCTLFCRLFGFREFN